MELVHLQEIDFKELPFETFDGMISVCAYQPKCTYLAIKINNPINDRFLLTLSEQDNQEKNEEHAKIFQQLGFQTYPTSYHDNDDIENLFSKLCSKNADQLNILIDYSCMPVRWFTFMTDILTRNNFKAERINLYFSYSPEIFDRRSDKYHLEYIGPVLHNRDNLRSKKPVSLIISLDNTKDIVLEAIRLVNPQKITAFIPICDFDPEYSQLVMKSNKNLLSRLNKDSIISYEASHLEDINSKLTSYCLNQRISSEVMIIPQGPKTFALISTLLSVRYPDIKLWEINSRDQNKLIDNIGLPAAMPVVVKASFIHDELEIDGWGPGA
jgi:hypothetical protein